MKIEKAHLFDKQKKSGEKLNGHSATRVHFEDLSLLKFPTNSDVAEYLNRARNWMMEGVEVRFINTPDQFRQKIIALGLEDVFKMES